MCLASVIVQFQAVLRLVATRAAAPAGAAISIPPASLAPPFPAARAAAATRATAAGPTGASGRSAPTGAAARAGTAAPARPAAGVVIVVIAAALATIRDGARKASGSQACQRQHTDRRLGHSTAREHVLLEFLLLSTFGFVHVDRPFHA